MELRRENTLSQLVLDSIQNSIRDGEFKPGELLPSEREMSERYGVGKSSIREAIKMLQVLGVVESAQGKGTYLKESIGPQILRPLLLDMMLQRSSAEELYEFRLMFEQAYMSLAAAKRRRRGARSTNTASSSSRTSRRRERPTGPSTASCLRRPATSLSLRWAE